MTLADLEATVASGLPSTSYHYVAGGADDELTLADNVAAWSRLRIRPRVLRDVETVDVSTTLLGAPVSSPVHVSPTGYHELLHADGETATARGAAAAGSAYVLSTVSTVSMEDVAAAVPDGLRWFQIYVHSDRDLTLWLLKRAEAAGYRALVMTVDTPVLGRRRRDGAGFVLPDGVSVRNLDGYPGTYDPSNLKEYAANAFDASLTPGSIGWLAAQTSLPIVVKGVLRADDAQACVAAGASGVLVSNHGGRQLDGVIATADAVASIAEAVGDRAEVYVDGGIRRGTDVLRALALGARAVFVGRPALWGLGAGGADGVRDVLRTLAAETRLAFQLAGVRSCAEATRDLLA
ncbi:MAG: alpha-hydroxy acid oxidase [Jatrophihabitans sp.]